MAADTGARPGRPSTNRAAACKGCYCVCGRMLTTLVSGTSDLIAVESTTHVVLPVMNKSPRFRYLLHFFLHNDRNPRNWGAAPPPWDGALLTPKTSPLSCVTTEAIMGACCPLKTRPLHVKFGSSASKGVHKNKRNTKFGALG